MTSPDMWGGDRVWTINDASDSSLNKALTTLKDVLMMPKGAGRTQFRLAPIQQGDTVVGYDVVPINLPPAWTVAPCRFFCFGLFEPQWPPFDPSPPGPKPPTRPLATWDNDPNAHHAVAFALQRNYGNRPSVARLVGEIHVGTYKTPETITLLKVEDAIVGGRVFLSVIVDADITLFESGIAHGNN